jgi:transcriptional regulator with XRE-family HTH domain
VAALLRVAQHYTGSSQARLAAAIGLAQSRCNEIFNGKRRVVQMDVLERVAAGLQMPDAARMLMGLAPLIAGDATSVDDLTSAAGLAARTYASQAQAARDIRARVATASAVDMLIVRGLGLLGLSGSLLRLAVAAPRARPLLLRVALLNPDGEIAARRAAEIGESPQSFSSGVELACQRLRELAQHSDITVRLYQYDRLPTWRLIIVDDTLYLGTYDSNWEGHASPIYRLDAGTGGAVHRGMRRMYEDLVSEAIQVI